MPDWQALERQYYMQTVKRLPVTLVRGQGTRVWDDKGKEYLDFVAGWAVTSLGHCHPVVIQALTEQAGTLIHTSNQFYTVPQIMLAELLVKHSCLDRVFLSNSGTEANEGAVKMARKYGKIYRNNAFEVITTMNSFHGRTLAMVAATGQANFQSPYVPMPAGFINVEYNQIEAIRRATSDNTCAIMIEVIQGEGGVNVASDEYLQEVRAWCDEKGLLLILDEVQTGVGRTGTMFGYEHSGIEPDIMTLAKGLGSGVPIGAILAKEKAAVLEPGEHGATFGGNALVSAAAYATVKYVLDNDILGNVCRMSDYMLVRLQELRAKYPLITDIRGRGLLMALQFRRDVAEDALMACLDKGLLVNRVKPNTLRLMPALTIGRDEVDRAMVILGQVMEDLQGP